MRGRRDWSPQEYRARYPWAWRSSDERRRELRRVVWLALFWLFFVGGMLSLSAATIAAGAPGPEEGPTVGDVLDAVDGALLELQGGAGNVSVGELEGRLDLARNELEAVDPGKVSGEELDTLERRVSELRAELEAQGGESAEDLDLRAQAVESRISELQDAQVTPTATATRTPDPAPPRDEGAPEDYEHQIDRVTLLVSYQFRGDTAHIRVWSETPQLVAVSDVFSGLQGSGGVGQIRMKRLTLKKGMNNLEFPATAYNGHRAVTLGTRGAAITISEAGGSPLFTGAATWGYVRAAGLTAALTMAGLIGLLAYRRRNKIPSEPERVV